jgi:hypothetical protein
MFSWGFEGLERLERLEGHTPSSRVTSRKITVAPN